MLGSIETFSLPAFAIAKSILESLLKSLATIDSGIDETEKHITVPKSPLPKPKDMQAKFD